MVRLFRDALAKKNCSSANIWLIRTGRIVYQSAYALKAGVGLHTTNVENIEEECPPTLRLHHYHACHLL
ncbi:hypothetical protein BC943DRAFT_313462 [Umbelopsis sp. AD052]|nr:hypothetical protein BC943DRAFT_313462 [Umbelopsis sp. AD052]